MSKENKKMSKRISKRVSKNYREGKKQNSVSFFSLFVFYNVDIIKLWCRALLVLHQLYY